MAKSYKPFIPLLQERINQRHGSTKILTNIGPEVIYAAQELSDLGAEYRRNKLFAISKKITLSFISE